MRDLDRIHEKVVIRLDNRQVAWALLGFLAVVTGVFAAGVLVGRQMGDALPRSLEEIAGVTTDGVELDSAQDHRERQILLARVGLGTRDVDGDLARSAQLIRPSSPTEAARIEAHRQISAARAGGVQRSLGPVPVVSTPPAGPAPAPLTLIARPPPEEAAAAQAASAWTLQVAAFGSEPPARVVAGELKGGGHDVRIREVADDGGRHLFRVEVGQFGSSEDARGYQRRFEAGSGYSTLVVAIR